VSTTTQFIYGFHAVTARLRQAPDSVVEVYLLNERRDPRATDLAALAAEKGVRLIATDSQRLDGMTQGARHQGVVAKATFAIGRLDLDDVLDQAGDAALILLLDGVTDPHNLGACLRVADFFGAHAVAAPKDRAVGLTPAVIKVASGAAETVPYVMVTNLARTIEDLQERGVRVLGAALGGHSLYQADVTGPIAWVLGAEGTGLRRLTRERCDQLVEIPRRGNNVDSLNVSVAAALCLSESARRGGRN